MSQLKYRVIEFKEQYNEYCDILEELLVEGLNTKDSIEEYKLLSLLIKNWDERNRLIPKLDPIEFLRSLMKEHGLKQNQLAKIAGINTSYMSEILNYKKQLSKNVIRNLAEHFKIQQEALNRSYRLNTGDN